MYPDWLQEAPQVAVQVPEQVHPQVCPHEEDIQVNTGKV